MAGTASVARSSAAVFIGSDNSVVFIVIPYSILIIVIFRRAVSEPALAQRDSPPFLMFRLMRE